MSVMQPDLSTASDLCCDECGGMFFRDVSMFKVVSALVSPTGTAQMIQIPVFSCIQCGHINSVFLPQSLKNDGDSSKIIDI